MMRSYDAVWLGLALALGLNLHDDIARSGGLMTATAGFYTFGAAALAANLGREWLIWANGLSALLINLNLETIPKASLQGWLNALIVMIHALGWAWVILWLLGLGTMARFIWHRWVPGAASLDPRRPSRNKQGD